MDGRYPITYDIFLLLAKKNLNIKSSDQYDSSDTPNEKPHQ